MRQSWLQLVNLMVSVLRSISLSLSLFLCLFYLGQVSSSRQVDWYCTELGNETQCAFEILLLPLSLFWMTHASPFQAKFSQLQYHKCICNVALLSYFRVALCMSLYVRWPKSWLTLASSDLHPFFLVPSFFSLVPALVKQIRRSIASPGTTDQADTRRQMREETTQEERNTRNLTNYPLQHTANEPGTMHNCTHEGLCTWSCARDTNEILMTSPCCERERERERERSKEGLEGQKMYALKEPKQIKRWTKCALCLSLYLSMCVYVGVCIWS